MFNRLMLNKLMLKNEVKKLYNRGLKKRIKGQSIIEVIVAIGILGVTIGGIIFLLVNVSNYGSVSEARSLAINFAQQAMDGIKTIRDNDYCNFYSNTGNYQDGYFNIKRDPNGNWRLERLNPQPAATDAFRNIDDMTVEMRRGTGMDENPMPPAVRGGRRIRITTPAADTKRVEVTIRWQTKGSPVQDYVTVTEMYKWKY